MPDFAHSDDPAVQRQLDRLAALSVGDTLGLERIQALLDRLGNPETKLPPVLHVAGTNGKGSTCAYLRAMLEAAGLVVHVYTSPHLVRFNERIRVADRLIDDESLARHLTTVLDAADDIRPSFFEATTAAAFFAFAETPADACIVEVGLGGRLDATNVLAAPVACGIAQLGLDHQQFLGERLDDIAAEKAGIAKPGVPLLTQHYPAAIANRVGQVAQNAGAEWLARGGRWDAAVYQERLHYRDHDGKLDLPLPRLAGMHQAMNAALAIAMLRHQRRLAVPPSAIRAGIGWAQWPARLQRLSDGPLTALLPENAQLWLDGGHNPAAARAIADHFRGLVPAGGAFHIVFGLLANKDLAGVLRAFTGREAVVHAVPVPGHAHHAPDEIVTAAKSNGFTAMPSADVAHALQWIARHADRNRPPIVLVMGSLYLAGTVLAENGQIPD